MLNCLEYGDVTFTANGILYAVTALAPGDDIDPILADAPRGGKKKLRPLVLRGRKLCAKLSDWAHWLRAVQDHEVTGKPFLRGLRQAHRMALNFGGYVVERDEPTDSGLARVVQVCYWPSSLTGLFDLSERVRF